MSTTIGGDIMATNKYTEARKKANEKYNAKAYDEIKIRVKKGEKETIKAHAESKGESLNGFINRAIDETIKRDNE
jgi:predicted HicB family RNase H-like nuclease